MKGLFWLVMLGLMPYISAAQDTVTFNRTYDFNQGYETGSTVLALDDGYLVCASGYATEYDGWWAIKLLRTDLNGNELWRKVYGQVGQNYSGGLYGGMVKVPSGGFVLAASIGSATQTSAKGILYRFDENGDTLWTKTFQKGYKEQLYQVKCTPDGGYALFGISFKQSPLNPNSESPGYYLVKTDSMGDIEWDTVYGGFGYGTIFDLTDDNGYVLGGYGGVNGNYNARIMKVDTYGGILWQKMHFAGNSEPCYAYTSAASDGGFYIWGCYDTVSSPTDFYLTPYLAKTDSIGNLLWTNFYFSPNNRATAVYQVKEFSNGRIMLAGERGVPIEPIGGGWIVYMEHNGSTIWEKVHYSNNDTAIGLGPNLIYDFQALTDGGFILTGDGFTDIDPGPNFNNNQDIWLLKLDSLGNYYAPPDTTCPPPCDTVGITEPQTLQAKLYPNPTTGTLTVELPNGQSGNLELYNLLGQSVFNATINGTATLQMDLPKGVYIYRIAQDGLEKMGRLVVE